MTGSDIIEIAVVIPTPSAASEVFLPAIEATGTVATAHGKDAAKTMVSLTSLSMGSQFTARNVSAGIKTVFTSDAYTRSRFCMTLRRLLVDSCTPTTIIDRGTVALPTVSKNSTAGPGKLMPENSNMRPIKSRKVASRIENRFAKVQRKLMQRDRKSVV